jgi:hypothetical protein
VRFSDAGTNQDGLSNLVKLENQLPALSSLFLTKDSYTSGTTFLWIITAFTSNVVYYTMTPRAVFVCLLLLLVSVVLVWVSLSLFPGDASFKSGNLLILRPPELCKVVADNY